MKKSLTFRFPTALTILPTYRCTAACENCCFHCSPKVPGRIPQNRIIKYIRDASEIPSIKLVVFSGGECFLLGKDLDDAIAWASRLGLRTRCVTNAYWATSKHTTKKRLQAISDAGLNELNISTGDFHQKWVPIENVIRTAVEGVAMGMTIVIMVEVQAERKFTLNTLISDHTLSKILKDKESKKLLYLLESPWMSSHTGQKVEQNAEILMSEKKMPQVRGCTSVLSTLIISPSESLGACCGLAHEQIPEMRIGSLREHSLSQLVENSKNDFLKLWLMIEGPYHILKWASEKDQKIKWEGKYVHLCDACRLIYSDSRIRKAINQHYKEKVEDILFRFTMFDRFGLAQVKN